MSPAPRSKSETETEDLGRRLAATLAPGDVVYLIGDLGAGKTCLARGIALGLGASVREIASPTFALLHEYAGRGDDVVVRHLDLYRLADEPAELEPLGLPDSVAGAPVLVEWPGRALRRVLPPTLEIEIETLSDGERSFRIERVVR